MKITPKTGFVFLLTGTAIFWGILIFLIIMFVGSCRTLVPVYEKHGKVISYDGYLNAWMIEIPTIDRRGVYPRLLINFSEEDSIYIGKQVKIK
jgi:hypothetical protein